MASQKSKSKDKNPSKSKKKIVKPKKDLGSSYPKHWMIALIGVLVITFLTFFPALNNEFVNWDDYEHIVNNSFSHAFNWHNIKGAFTNTVMGGYIPLTTLSFAIEKEIFGLTAGSTHTINVVLHLLCTLGVFFTMLRLGLPLGGTIIVALLFGIHPMRVESVAWATERKDVLFGLFFILGLLTYIRYIDRSDKRFLFFGLTIVLFTLSLFSKIQAVTFPLTLLLIDYFKNRKFTKSVILEKIPFFALSLFVGMIGINFLTSKKVLSTSEGFNFFERLIIGAYSFVVYIVKWLIPYELLAVYPYPKDLPVYFYAAPIVILALFFVLYKFFRNQKAILFGVGFFLINVVFMLQIVGAGHGFIADRFTYIPYIGLFFIVGWTYEYWIKQKPSFKTPLHIGLGIYLAGLAFMAFRQCDTWQNSETLWSNIIEQRPDNAKEAYVNRGNYYRDKTKNQLALKDYDKALSIDPAFLKAYNNRSVAHYNLGTYGQALKDVNYVIGADPNYRKAYINRAAVYLKTEQFSEAIKDYDKCLKLNPNTPKMYYFRAVAKQQIGRHKEALEDLNIAIRYRPNDGNYYHNRSYAYKSLGNMDLARQDAQKALKMGVKVSDTHLNSIK